MSSRAGPVSWLAEIRRGRRALGVAGCLTAAGCASTPAPQVAVDTQFVAAGQAVRVAERVAAQHEGDFVVRGEGESMEPCFSPGTVLVVHPTSFFMLRAGLPVVYRTNHGPSVAHVLVEAGADGWVVRGVNNAVVDDERVTPENLLGVVRCAYRELPPAAESRVAAAHRTGAPRPFLLH